MGIEEIINDLTSQGLKPEQILESLKQMLSEGKITQEDLDKAMAILNGGGANPTPAEPTDEEKAGKLLGVKF